jgi:6-methylsalicylate decarboxylase
MIANPRRIDLHHHIIPPAFAAAMARRNIEWTGDFGAPPWSVPFALETMERHGIAAAVASFQPQVYWGDLDEAVRWAREGNEFVARIVQDDPQHFGGLASLPLPDVDAAIRELEYAFDVLKLDGVFAMTSVDGYYLGDPRYDELCHELNRRSAVVIVHPNTTPPGADVPKLKIPHSMMEFTFDTTRLVANLLYSGTLERYPNIRFVMPHAGGTVPYLAWRIAIGAEVKPQMRERVPKGVLHYLRTNIFYDTAVSTSEYVFAALKQFVPSSQIVFGSDFPFVRGPLLDAEIAALEHSQLLNDDDRAAIDRGSALKLFPRFSDSAVPSATTRLTA